MMGLKGHVNASGFPLQIGLQTAIDSSTSSTGWRTAYSEHSWENPNTGESGFIDLVLSDQAGYCFMNIECKRVKDTSWIFLKDKEATPYRRHVKAFVSSKVEGNFTKFGWHDICLEPSTPQSNFCIIPGSDNKSMSLIERSSAELVSATEGVALEQKQYHKDKSLHYQIYFNVIVTTAKLEVCEYNSSEFDLANGTFKSYKAVEVPFLRYRKQLSVIHDNLTSFESADYDLASMKESTIFVVNSLGFVDFLKQFEVDNIYSNKAILS